MSVECNCGTEILGLLLTRLEQNGGHGRTFQNCLRQRQSERKDKGPVNSANPILLYLFHSDKRASVYFESVWKIVLRRGTEVVAVEMYRETFVSCTESSIQSSMESCHVKPGALNPSLRY